MIIAIIVLGFSYMISDMYILKHEADSIYKVRLLSIDYLIEADRDAYQSSIAISQALNHMGNGLKNAGAIDELVKLMYENHEQVNARFGKFRALFSIDSDVTEHREFSVFDEKYKNLDALTKRIEALMKQAKGEDLKNLYFGEYTANFDSMRDAMDKLTETTLSIAEKEYNYFNTVFSRNIILSIMMALVIFVILLISGIVLTRSITKPVKMGVEFASSLASGDLTRRINLNQEDELGILGKSLNNAADNLERLLASIIESSRTLAQAVQQISSGNENLSQRTSEQASSLEEVASTVEEATATINQNADNAARAKELTDGGAAKSREGNWVALEAIKSINEMSESSKKVAEIISLINDIAFQTNLLALNAAVEAARAGEQGRGFAVVAGEVRNLAQRSGNAAKEIADLIKDSVDKVERGTELVNNTGQSLSDISVAAESTAQIISEIAIASQEQKQGISQINQAISELDTMTQQNASLVEETASASELMANQAQELLAFVQNFKVSDTLRGPGTGIDAKRVNAKAADNQINRAGKNFKEKGKINGGKGRAAADKNGVKENSDLKQTLAEEGFEEF